MNTARIVVLTIAIGAGGVAACLARGTDDRAQAPDQPVAQLPAAEVLGRTATLELKPGQAETLARSRQAGTLSLALRSNADVNKTENNEEEAAPRKGAAINVVRYGVQSSMTTQK